MDGNGTTSWMKNKEKANIPVEGSNNKIKTKR